VAVGLAIAMAALIYRGQQNDPSKGLPSFTSTQKYPLNLKKL
jgi:hypothetical protein